MDDETKGKFGKLPPRQQAQLLRHSGVDLTRHPHLNRALPAHQRQTRPKTASDVHVQLSPVGKEAVRRVRRGWALEKKRRYDLRRAETEEEKAKLEEEIEETGPVPRGRGGRIPAFEPAWLAEQVPAERRFGSEIGRPHQGEFQRALAQMEQKGFLTRRGAHVRGMYLPEGRSLIHYLTNARPKGPWL